MADNVTLSAMPGLLVLDPRWTYADAYDATNSSLTQAGPVPGAAEAQQDTSMVLQASGTMAAGTQLRIRAIKGGSPDIGDASFAWRYQGDADWRGWNPPTVVTAWECLDFTTTASKWLYPHAVRLADDTVLVVIQKSGTTITVWKRATAGTWSEITVATHGTYTYGAWPCLVVLPSGRVLCYAWWEDGTTSNNVRQYYSDDNGATWTLGSQAVLSDSITVGGTITPKRLRAATYNGQVLLVVGLTDTALAYDHYLSQYASVDGGASFSRVETWLGSSLTTHAAWHDLLVVNGAFVLGYLASDGTNSLPFVRRITNAYTPFSSAEVIAGYETTAAVMDWSTLTAAVVDYGANTTGDYALALDDDGILYAVGRDHSGGGSLRECYVVRSITDGVSWQSVGYGSAPGPGSTWWNHQDATTYPLGFAAVFQAGRLLVPCSRLADGTTTDPSLDVVYLGGYATVTLPGVTIAPSAVRRVSWERTWFALTFPESAASIWTKTTGGAPATSLTQTGVRVTGGVGDTEVWAAVPTSTLPEGLIATADIKAVGGTAYLALRSGMAGPITYEIRVDVSPTQIILRDLSAGTALVTVTTTAGATGVQVLAAVGAPSTAGGAIGYGAAWYRATGGVAGSDQKWIAIGSSTTLADGASSTTNSVRFGNLGATAADDVTFRHVHYTQGSYTGTSAERLYRGQTNPTDLFGRFLTTTPTYVDGGTRIRGIDGPAARGDVWNIDADYNYPIRNVFPDVAPSPQVAWRSTVETQTDIVWTADPATVETTEAVGPLRALGIFEANWRTGELYGMTALNVWVKIADIDLSNGSTALAWTLEGSLIQVDTGVSKQSATFYTENQLARATFKMDGGTPMYRRIRTNRGGSWTNVVTQRTRILLDDCDGSEPGSGTAGEIWFRSGVVAVPSANAYKRYRLRITAQTTADGYFTIGTLMWGHLAPFAKRYARGRVMTTTPNVEITTQRSGTRTAIRRGRARRGVDVAWTDGTDTSALWRTSPAPDYVLGYTGSTDPIGAPAETPSMVHGLAADLADPSKLVVYLARYVPPGSASVVTITHPDQHILCRLTTEPRSTAILGQEFDPNLAGEVIQVETVALEEEV